ncbi:hypothetical protein FQA39_LY16978 [Lamprigera yunnana]|nr:hypothetical protein FQA39_LY16978 [Lamprigera yunnana]
MMLKICILIVGLILFNTEAYKNTLGDCLNVKAQANFDMKRMLGTWYVTHITATSKRCFTYTINTKLGNEKKYLLFETFSRSPLEKYLGFRSDRRRIGTLYVANVTQPAIMEYKAPSEIWKYKFTVLDTDYSNYAVAYSCKKISFGLHRWAAMILSRKRSLNHKYFEMAIDKLARYYLDASLSFVNQHNCEVDIKNVTEIIRKSSEQLSKIIRDHNMMLKKPEANAESTMKMFKSGFPRPKVMLNSSTIDKESNNVEMNMNNYDELSTFINKIVPF